MTDLTISPFTIIIDTREQLPYGFDSLKNGGKNLVVPIKFKGLPTGDYSIEGFEDTIAIERKSLEDLYSTLGHARERFEREFIRLNRLDCAVVAVEATLSEIYNPYSYSSDWRSKLAPLSVLGTIAAWKVRYSNVQWLFCGNRTLTELMIYQLLEKYYQQNHGPNETNRYQGYNSGDA